MTAPTILPDRGRYLAAARWQMFERVATDLVTELLVEQWERAGKVHERYAVRDAQAGNGDGAKHEHEVANACRERAELIRRYPEEFTDTAHVLDLILNEGVAA